MIDVARSGVARAAATTAPTAAAASLCAFSAELYGALARAGKANLVCSPYSVAVALAMAVQGARGRTAEQMLTVLHGTSAQALADGLNAVDLALAARPGTVPDPAGGKDRVIELTTANSLWGRRDIRWETPFLDVLARDFGTGMRLVDYAHGPDRARRTINDWVSRQTHAKIPELIGPGLIDEATVLTLVNAIYLRAPWKDPFERDVTRRAPFTRVDGSSVEVDLMSATMAAGYAKGPGWVAVDLPYLRGELAMAVVVPDAGAFASVEKAVDGAWLSRLLTGFRDDHLQVGLPRWTTRSPATLNQVLAALGMPLAFTSDADFSGMTPQVGLEIAAVVHQAFIGVDEAGTEAAAATAVMVRATAALQSMTPPVIADRPFLYVIHDRPTGTPLFVGRVLDPTAG